MGSPASRPPPPRSSLTRQRWWTRSTSCGSPARLSTDAANASNKTCAATGAAAVTRCIRPAGPYAPGADLLTDKQATRLEDLFAGDDHVEVEATWGIYQRLVQAYRCTDPGLGSHLMASVIETIATGVPAQLTELVRLGHTLKHRATDILAFFDHPGTSNGPHRSTQRPPRTPPRLRSRVPEPDPLHRPLPPRNWQFQAPTTPSNRMSPPKTLSCMVFSLLSASLSSVLVRTAQ